MNDKNTVPSTEEKMLGAKVPADVYWEFKRQAAMRKEGMAEALTHAALLYINAIKEAK